MNDESSQQDVCHEARSSSADWKRYFDKKNKGDGAQAKLA